MTYTVTALAMLMLAAGTLAAFIPATLPASAAITAGLAAATAAAGAWSWLTQRGNR